MEKVFSHIEKHADGYIQELVRLCSQPSISPKKLGLSDMAELCERTMCAYGINARQIPLPGGPPIVYGELKGKSPKTLLIYHHYDVQAVEPLDLWESLPFEPEIRGDKLFGRGVVDNKGSFMTRLAAVKAYLDVYGELPISLKFFVEGEEEVGSPHLETFLIENKELLAADTCLWSGEVTWDHQAKITLGLKGYVSVILKAKGAAKELHALYATSVVNPIWRLVWALNTLKDPNENVLIKDFYDKVIPPTEDDLNMLRRVPSDEEKLKKDIGVNEFLQGLSGFDLQVRDTFTPALNISDIWSGKGKERSSAVLPSTAQARVDFRLVPNMEPADVVEKLRRHLDDHGFGDITVMPVEHGMKPWRTPTDNPFIQIVTNAASIAYGKDPLIVPIMNAGGNMGLFGTILRVPIATSGVRFPDSRIHAPNENVRIKDFVACIKHVAAIFEGMRNLE